MAFPWLYRVAKIVSRRTLRLEWLEPRSLLSISAPGVAVPYLAAFDAGPGVAPLSTAGPTGYSPQQVRHAYGFDKISFGDGAIAGDGSGTTIAIVDAYDDPRIANDLHQFDLAFGLPDPVFTKVNQFGGATYPVADAGWATEIALDVEWAHAIAPKANILLVEASDSSYSNLLAAVDYARRQSGVVAVSMSWGGGEFFGESTYDGYFTTPPGHAGVTFLAASGDSGAPASYPATSPYVVAVGGTTLRIDSLGNYLSESGWSGSGGGLSQVVSQPSYQAGVVTQSTIYRGNPDVAYDSNPATGFPVYDSYSNPVSAPWGQWGGTSDAAPQWAALIAIADQGRMLAGKGSLDGATQTLPLLYSLASSDFHDVSGGTSNGTPRLSAAAGYDLVTGRGSPVADLVVNDLVGTTSTTPGSGASVPTISSVVVAEATRQDGILESNEEGVITWAVTDGDPIRLKSVMVDGTDATAIYGPYGPYSGSYYYAGVFGPLAAGTHSYTIQVTDNAGLTTSVSGTFVVAAAPAPLISSVVVAEATYQDGILDSTETGVVTWAVTDSSTITTKSLMVDGAAANAVYGPYGPYGDSYYYAGVFGPLTPGTHNYLIQVTNSAGVSATYSGTFTVASPVVLIASAARETASALLVRGQASRWWEANSPSSSPAIVSDAYSQPAIPESGTSFDPMVRAGSHGAGYASIADPIAMVRVEFSASPSGQHFDGAASAAAELRADLLMRVMDEMGDAMSVDELAADQAFEASPLPAVAILW